MKTIDLNTWDRRLLFDHFKDFLDPYFAVTLTFDVSTAYKLAKHRGISFFGKYLHDCMKAINEIDNLKYRVIEDSVVKYDTIHASATIARQDNSFGFSFIHYDEDLKVFLDNLEKEKQRIAASTALFPPNNSLDCIYCSALPWIDFTGHKEPVSNMTKSVPQLAFGKVNEGKMRVAISVNHALADGYHVGLFAEKFQFNLNN